ncbi:hypothetical protein [Staphylococcus epidermidis]|nr:hypothetical protein [Staphylococcus epidermidis]
MEWMEEEEEGGISIRCGGRSAEWEGEGVKMIDSGGEVELRVEVEG